ncbi:phage protein [Escherichia coli]|nr:phage protein [Escherichia coli]
MDSVHHIWCPLFSQEFQDLPDGAETTLTFDFSKLIREIRVMAEKLSTWKFILIWLVFVIMASGYFIGQIRWW